MDRGPSEGTKKALQLFNLQGFSFNYDIQLNFHHIFFQSKTNSPRDSLSFNF